MYDIRVEQNLTTNPVTSKMLKHRREYDMFNDFREIDTMNKLINVRVGLLEVLRLHSNGAELLFMYPAQVPKLFEEVQVAIKFNEDRIMNFNFNAEALEDLYNLSDFLFDKYNIRLTEHYYLINFGKSKGVGIDDVALGDVKLKRGIRMDLNRRTI